VRRYIALAAAALALAAAAAPAAQANHVAPTASASLELGGKVADCDPGTFVCGGARRATISWNASCGPGHGHEALESIEVLILGVTPTGRRFTYSGETLDFEAPFTGSLDMTAGPGLRFLGQVIVTCAVETVDSEGNAVTHRASATAETQQLYRPPFLRETRITSGSWCGVNLTPRQTERLLQAGQYAEVAWTLRFDAASLMRRGVPASRQIRLHARGAGIRVKKRPDRGMLRDPGVIGTWFTPRRAGKLKVWATIGGKKTNVRRMRVLPKRC
jgi:hypothetical protein